MIKAAHLRRPRLGLSAPAGGWARLGPALAAGLLWLAAGLSGGYWLLQAWGRSPVTPLTAVAAPLPQTDVAAVARTLGAVPQAQPAAAPVASASRLQLLGVVARPGQRGAALIAIDGQPPRPYTVGATLDGALVLQSVDRRTARLGPALQGPTTVELSLPSTE